MPTGLPGVHFPAVTIEDFKRLAVAGLGVAIVAYGDNSLIERGFPAPPDERGGPSRSVDPDQELIALAGVHVATGLVGGFPGSSSGSRTALALANGVPYGLASSVWTSDHGTALRMSRRLDFGCVWINTHIPFVAEMPHGGFKHSGYGKDLSMYGFEDYTRVKHVMANIES